MPLSQDLFDKALSNDIRKEMPASIVVADSLKDITFFEEYIQETHRQNPTAAQILFTVWYQCEWVVIEYYHDSKSYIAYTKQKLSFPKIKEYRLPKAHQLHNTLTLISNVSDRFMSLDLEKNMIQALEQINFSVEFFSCKSFPKYWALEDDNNHSYHLFEVSKSLWLNAHIDGNTVKLYGKPDVFKSSNIEKVKNSLKELFDCEEPVFKAIEQESIVPSFHLAMNNLVQLSKGIHPSLVFDYKLLEAFSYLAIGLDAQKSHPQEVLDIEELFEQLELINVSFNEATQQFHFDGKPNLIIKLMPVLQPIENSESSRSSDESDVEPFVIFYQDNADLNQVFIIGMQETFKTYQSEILNHPSLKNKKVKCISHDIDMEFFDYFYLVFSQIQQGKDIQLLDPKFKELGCDSAETDGRPSYYSSFSEVDRPCFFKPSTAKLESVKATSVSREILINSVIFALGASCLAAFCITLTGPALFVGLFLFVVLAIRIFDGNPKTTPRPY